MSAQYQGPWRPYSELALTPIVGSFVNVVCCDPSRWVWKLKIPMAKQDTGAMGEPGEVEIQEGIGELHCEGVRNVLVAFVRPVSNHQIRTAEKYDAIVVPSDKEKDWWTKMTTKVPHVLPMPTQFPSVFDHVMKTIALWSET